MKTNNDPFVSICCITYNHEKYIRDAIEGFLKQKTNFPYEIIIHDDASTDNTAEIIREYQKKYPELIKPIYQTENKYSKGEKVSLIAFKAARGKYIALCEGDDYWIDPFKLQKQVNEMESHPECNISFHPAIQKYVAKSMKDEIIDRHYNKNTLIPIEDVILCRGMFMPTASIMISRSAIPRIVSFFEYAKEAPVGDYYIQVLGAENGGALFLKDVMSAYRFGFPGSWRAGMKANSNMRYSFLYNNLLAHDKLKAFTNNKYDATFERKKQWYYSGLIRDLDIDINIKENLIDIEMNKVSIEDKILWKIIFKNPLMVSILRRMHLYEVKSKIFD